VAGRVVVLGGGSTGEAFAAALRRYDDEVPITLVERELVGGECTYWACMPSKTLLRSPEVVAAARRAPGAAEAVTGTLDAERIFWWRDQVVENLDDSGHEQWLGERRVELVRGLGRVVEAGTVEVDGRRIEYEKLVIATGSVPSVPPIEGLKEVEFWTNREATNAREVPQSLLVLGAGPVGCELAQFFRRLGSHVVVLDVAERLLPRDDAEAASLVKEQFEAEGIELRLGVQIERVEAGVRLELAGGERFDAERLLVATGRKATVEGLGFERLGLEFSARGIAVDERLRAADNVWAIGDVTGVAMFTHVGKYQGRVAAADVAGLDVRADYRAIPAVTFTDPQVASAGRTAGEGLVESRWNLPARASTYERPRRPGFVKLFADPERGVLVGAVAVGPEAGEWLQQLTLAIRAEVPVDVLRDTIQPYPTFSEAVFFAARDLPV
jgi:pyruvate/2-oxoglutarate dehydrogenase complex dihydrolipoamide dehydrogenase (E3) component